MRHRTATAAGAALTAALLLTTACGTDDSSDDVAGVDEAGQKDGKSEDEDVQVPQDEASEDDGIDRPDIELPDDMNHVFEDTETGDPVKDEIIADVVRALKSVDLGVAEGDPHQESVDFYHTLDAQVTIEEYIDSAASSDPAGRSWRGEIIHYDFVVDNEGKRENEPIVSYCSDRSEVDIVDLATGDTLSGDEYAGGQKANQVVLEQTDLGVWQHRTILRDDAEKDRQCAR